ncbi:Beta-glucosidase A [Nymphon striatum]|nr:Beta-glucosidase A [Nymphon striatum]
MNLKELSTLLGLSQTTVSRALNGYPEVREETRKRVAEAAREHNYRPNTRAKGLATGRALAIGHVIPVSTKHEMVNPVFGDFIAGAGDAYSAAGFDMVLSLVDDRKEEAFYRELAAKQNVDGIILHGPSLKDSRIGLLKELGMQFAVHGRSSEITAPYNWLDVNNMRAFQRATDFLLDLGHRRIALINGLEHMDFAHRRRTGYSETLQKNGIPIDPTLMRSSEMTEGHGYTSTRDMLALGDPPTAFLASSIIVAIGIRRAIHEAGLEMGRDVSVITHDDDISYFRNGDEVPQFTAVKSSVRDAGRELADMLIQQIANPMSPPVTRLLEAQLVVGRSTGPIEGHKFGGAGPTHWDSFAATPGNVVRAENGDLACDHYHRYGDDLDLVANAGLDSYRFSTSWARVLPEGRGTPNPEGLDYYDRLTDAMLERGLKPCVTLYHWEMPQALADLGGWRNPDIGNWFADFTEVIMGRIGDRMHSAATINEFWCVAWLSHFLGEHAPGLRDIRATARAMHHVLLAHGKSIQAMRGLGMDNLGAVFNMEWSQPADQSDAAIAAADRYDAIYNRFFLQGAFQGSYPDLVLDGLEPHLPKGWQDDFATITAPVDWCGVNYYTRKIVSPADTGWPALQDTHGPLPKTQMGWEIYPEGLYKFLKRTAQEYTKDLPLYVTENGMANADVIANGDINDPIRTAFINAHLQQIKAALDEGVPVHGYFLWSLLDNYEWALGYEKRFGMVHVDFENLKRTPKASYYAMQRFLNGAAG